MPRLVQQTWVLLKKDLIILVRRRWLGTLIRALIFPVVVTFVLSYIKYWVRTPGSYGIGTPSPITSFQDALAQTGKTRSNFVIINHGFTDGDIGDVVSNLSTTVQNSGKQLHLINDDTTLQSLCPASTSGVTNCYAAVEFFSSPDHPSPYGSNWNYTLHLDIATGLSLSIDRNNNDVQLYNMAVKRGIDEVIATTHGGSPLPSVSQYPYTPGTEQQKEQQDESSFQGLFEALLAFAFFIGLCDLTYLCPSYVCRQREVGITALVDAMLPNRYRWEAIVVRNLATHIAFDLIYFPGWVVMGVLIASFEFTSSGPGYFVLLYIMTGLALTSYSLLVSSIFRKAQLSGIVSVVAAFCLAVVAQFAESLTENPNESGFLAIALLFPPAAFVNFLVCAAGYQATSTPLDINNPSPIENLWVITPSTVFGLLVFQIVLYPLIGGVIEWYLHGTYSKARIVTHGSKDNGNAVVLDLFSKEYKSLTDKKQKVKAVSDLSLSIPAGAISVMLGANGSGKSTTLNSIAGLETITSGSITVDGTGGIGICPQKNIYWEDLTVQEHISLLESLKTARSLTRAEHKLEVNRLVMGCDLGIKRNAPAKTLSGGQKRKLQLAMMLAGGSRVCCIDEASSGIDPLARRKIWEILLNERGRRTLLLTTHFLDEAEVLSDQVAIMSQGQLKAEGSVATLKSKLGSGYRVIFDNKPAPSSLPQSDGVSYQSDYNQTIAQLPNTVALAAFITAIEAKGLTGYRINGPTIESIFLRLAEEMRAQSGLANDLRMGNADEHDSNSDSETLTSNEFDLTTGVGSSPLRQSTILFRKRGIVLRHNFWPYLCALFFPLTLAGVVTLFFKGLNEPNGVQCAKPSTQSYTPYTEYLEGYNVGYGSFVFGPPSLLPKLEPQVFNTTSYGYTDSVNWTSVPQASSYSDFQNYIDSNLQELYFGGIYLGSNMTNNTIAWGSNDDIYSTIWLQDLTNSIFTGKNITTGIQNFAQSFIPDNGIQSITAVITTLGFSIYPCLFALYPTAERLRHVRAMHYSNGIQSSSLWLAYFAFDMMFVFVISLVTIGIWLSQWQGWYAIGYQFVVFFLFGLASTAFSYAVSLFAGSQVAAMSITILLQTVASMLYFVGYVLTEVNAPLTQTYQWYNYITYTVGLVSPSANLMRSLFMTLNDFSLACQGTQLASYPGAISIYGQPILYLTLQALFLLAFLVFWESGRSLEVFGIHRRRKQQSDPEKSTISANPDAVEESVRLAPSNNGLRLMHLSRLFGKTRAVDDVSFGILPSEKFALLGPNGAGKSTTISLIRGELKPSRVSGEQSTIYIGGDDLARAPMAAKNHLGVCPQFDATDSMTLREHLRFYAEARGVPNVNHNMEELLTRLGLKEHAHKMASKLSGGTRRKLSLAIALIANPKVLLLDEPSSGMDPAAKRALWRTLAAVSEGRVLLLTTHSMEEADALCERVGIMAGKMLALGGTQDLRDRFGRSLNVHLVHASAPWTDERSMQKLREWVEQRWPGAEFERSVFGGQLRFHVPRTGDGDVLMGELFRAIEKDKDELGVADYAIGPATLDQVFLNVVAKHDVKEENTEEERKRWYTRGLFGKS